jgi:2-hydroxy-3-oxopropionate reductase
MEVHAYTRSKDKLDAFAASGGVAAESVADAARGAEFVITMLPDSPDVEDVALGPDGSIAAMDRDSVFIDMSTIREDVSRKIADAAAARDIHALDAPVSGGEQAAIEGTLSIMAGGAPDAFRRADPVFHAMGSKVVRVGGPGAGQTTKAANQMIVAGNIQVLAEAIVFLEAHGVDTGLALEAIGSGLGGSVVLDRKSTSMRERSFAPGFRSELHHKDLGIAQAAAREHGVFTPVTSLVAQLMASLPACGHGSLDHTALLKHVELLSGRMESTD